MNPDAEAGVRMRTDFRRRGGRAEGGYNNNLVFWVLSSKKSPSTAPIAASHRDAASSRRRALPHHRAQETTSAAVACRPGGDSVLQRLRPRRAILAAARPLPVRQEACLIRALAAVSSSPRAADTSCSPPPLAPRVDGKKKGKKSCTPPRRAGSATATAGVVDSDTSPDGRRRVGGCLHCVWKALKRWAFGWRTSSAAPRVAAEPGPAPPKRAAAFGATGNHAWK